jgi:uncharacterized membrane protein (UPF0127 family)
MNDMSFIKVKIGKKILKIKDCKRFSAIRGLMFENLEDKDGALMYMNFLCNSLCMTFVKDKLNLVFLDDKMRVLDAKIAEPMRTSYKTWKTYSCDNAKYCLELKDTRLKIKEGTQIIIMPSAGP